MNEVVKIGKRSRLSIGKGGTLVNPPNSRSVGKRYKIAGVRPLKETAARFLSRIVGGCCSNKKNRYMRPAISGHIHFAINFLPTFRHGPF